MQRIKRILFAGHDTPGSLYLLKEVLARHPALEWRVILTEGIYYRRSFFWSIKKLVFESSLTFCLEELLKFGSISLGAIPFDATVSRTIYVTTELGM